MDIQKSMLLWIPSDSESIEESDDLNAKVTAANGAVIDFCDRLITLDDLFQTVEYYEADVDEYRALLSDTLSLYGV